MARGSFKQIDPAIVGISEFNRVSSEAGPARLYHRTLEFFSHVFVDAVEDTKILKSHRQTHAYNNGCINFICSTIVIQNITNVEDVTDLI